MPRYRLLDQQGNDLGPFRAATPRWAPGDTIPRGEPGTSLVVLNVTPALDGDDVDGYLVVKPAE